MTRSTGFIGSGLLLATSLASGSPVSANVDASSVAECQSNAGVEQSICGVVNPEDLIQIAGTPFVVATSLLIPEADADRGEGGLTVIRVGDNRLMSGVISFATPARFPYEDCNGAPPDGNFQSHGIDYARTGNDTGLLFVVNHGGREAVEVFDVSACEERLSISWAGCVRAPAGALLNGVAGLPNGGFYTTKFVDTRWGSPIDQVASGERTGLVLQWEPGHGWSEVQGTQHVANNGIAISDNNRWLYVALWTNRSILKVDRRGELPPVRISVTFMPDNLHADGHGGVLAAGHVTDFSSFMRCIEETCPIDWAVARLDQQSDQVDYLLLKQGRDDFDAASSAIRVDDELWIGSVHGDRIEIHPYPAHPLAPQQ